MKQQQEEEEENKLYAENSFKADALKKNIEFIQKFVF